MLLTLLLLAVFVGAVTVWIYCKAKNRYNYNETSDRRKYFAKLFKDFSVFHNEKTLDMKTKLFESLHHLAKSKKDLRILEIGVGSGANLQFYPEGTKLTVVDPNPYFKTYLDEELLKYPNLTMDNFIVTRAEDLKEVKSNSVDVVVSTLVLCSCDNLQLTFQEIRRVLVPGGKFYFMEHVLDDKPISIIKIIQVLGSCLGLLQYLHDGCRPDKDLETEIRRGGFASVDIQRFNLDLTGVPWLVETTCFLKPHLYGTATV